MKAFRPALEPTKFPI